MNKQVKLNLCKAVSEAFVSCYFGSSLVTLSADLTFDTNRKSLDDWKIFFLRKFLGAENSYSQFLGEYNKACESFVPPRNPKKISDPVWINKKIKTLAKEKRRLWFKFKSFANKNVSDGVEFQKQYRAVSKELKTDIKRRLLNSRVR